MSQERENQRKNHRIRTRFETLISAEKQEGAGVLSLLIPCHRVIAANGALSGYRWKPERKAALLSHERAAVMSIDVASSLSNARSE